MTEEYVQANEMRNALTAIVSEIQSFHVATNNSCTSENSEILEKMIRPKSSLNLKKKQLQKLKENLKVACDIAKAVVSAKENSTGLLKSHLILAESESAELVEKQGKNTETIISLTMENKMLRDKIQNFGNFIELGYRELQKIRKERMEELPVIVQLKKLIIFCGQYYVDYCNENEKCMQLEQSNRYLYSKINILENNIEAITEEIRNLRYHNLRLHKENIFMKDKYAHAKTQNINIMCSKYLIENEIILPCNTSSNDDVSEDHLGTQIFYDIGLTSHLCTVKKLLSDQDSLLEDLKDISQELFIV